MDEDILIEVKLYTREIDKSADTVGRKLQKSFDAALGRPTGGGMDRVSKTLKLACAGAGFVKASDDLGRSIWTMTS